METRLPLLVVAALLVGTSGCVATSGCGTPSTTHESTSGSYVYTHAGPDAASPSGSSPCSSTSRGDIAAATGTSITGSASGTLTIVGTYDDVAGASHAFTAHVVGLRTGAHDEPPETGGEICDESKCKPLSWSADLSTFSTDCRGTDQCAVAAVGSLTASGYVGGGTLTLKLALDHVDEWQSSTCGSYANEGS